MALNAVPQDFKEEVSNLEAVEFLEPSLVVCNDKTVIDRWLEFVATKRTPIIVHGG